MGDVELPFRPGTVSWGVLRRPVFLLGGMNALLLQLAEPRVAAGVAEHSDFSNRVFDRLRHTVELMVEIGLGEPSDAEQALRDMAEVHRGVEGSMPDGSTYDAADPELRLWVLATLIATVLKVEARYVGEFATTTAVVTTKSHWQWRAFSAWTIRRPTSMRSGATCATASTVSRSQPTRDTSPKMCYIPGSV